MGYIRESNKGDFYFYVYEMKNYSVRDAIHWVKELLDSRVVSTTIITLRDSNRSLDEGNKSWQTKIPFDEKRIEKEIIERSIDKISFEGFFQSSPISINYNLLNNYISIGFDVDSKVDRTIFEKKMQLC